MIYFWDSLGVSAGLHPIAPVIPPEIFLPSPYKFIQKFMLVMSTKTSPAIPAVIISSAITQEIFCDYWKILGEIHKEITEAFFLGILGGISRGTPG